MAKNWYKQDDDAKMSRFLFSILINLDKKIKDRFVDHHSLSNTMFDHFLMQNSVWNNNEFHETEFAIQMNTYQKSNWPV